MKLFKKSEHCLFVEEETYNWAPSRQRVNKVLVTGIVLTLLLCLVLVTQL